MIEIPPNTIAAIPYNDHYRHRHKEVFDSLYGENKRDWFTRHFYFCLPLTIGNQYGFVVKAPFSFEAIWNGGEDKKDTTVICNNPEEALLSVKSHFGHGIITVQTAFHLRTPPNVNLITLSPPNYYIPGVHYMTGVIETDNLRRDFTFNLKLTDPKRMVKFEKGSWIGCFIPYPRHFIDKYHIADATRVLKEHEIKEEQQSGERFAELRKGEDQTKPHRNGRLYFQGVDSEGNPFPDHQKRLDKKV